MDEVIFHGSRSRKPSSFSEVTLSIHNNKATLPLEYTDIEISRRFYRDGESEFLINRNPCRLKDIMDLFMDTGMGSDAYSVIELKMIEAILSDLEDDRRRMFEEAAGVNKYKKQRRSAQRKLEATRQDLERVSDIIGEVESQVRALRLQLKRFARHERITAALKNRELALARLQIQELAREMAPLQETLETGRDSHQAEAALIAREEEQLGRLQATFSRREQELEAARQSLAAATGQLSELKEKQLVWGEQLHSTRRNLERLEQERETEVQRTGSCKAEIARLEKELRALEPALEKMQAAFEARRSEEETVTADFQRGEQQLQSARERKFNHRHLIQEEEARQQRTADMIRERRQELERLEQTAAERGQGIRTLEERRDTLTRNRKELETRLAGLVKEQEGITAQLQELDGRESRLREESRQVTTQLRVLQSRLEIFTELVESHEGYPGGTREVLTDLGRFPGLLGTVADLVEVEPVHAMAVETAMGSFATCLVAETVEQARQLLAYAAEYGLGRLSVIPLDRVTTGDDSAANPETAPGIPLMELIKVPGTLSGLYRRLLSGFYWASEGSLPREEQTVSAEDLFSGQTGLPSGVTVVTSAGHLVGAVPFLTHLDSRKPDRDDTSRYLGSGGVVGRAGELDRLREAIARAEQEADQLDARLGEVKDQRSQITQRYHGLKEEADTVLDEVDQSNRDLSQLEYELQRMTGDLTKLESQVPALNEIIRGLEESLAAHDKVIDHLKEQESRLEEAIRQAEAVYQQVQAKRDAWQEELQELRVELLTVENQRENLAGHKLSREDALAASNQRISQLEAEREQARQAIEDLTRRLEEAEEHRGSLEKDVSDQRAASGSKETAARETREQISRLEEQIRQRQHGREATLSQHQELELKLSDLKRGEELIRSRIREIYQEEITEEESVGEQEDEETLRAGVEKLRASLERIGPINMAVAEEYAEESKRLEFLTEQRDDLLQAEESLGKTIQKIDHQARSQFRETYDRIRHHFKQTFRLFFEGGEGDLRLVGDPDPLEAGIEIIAQPPGKKTRSLRSLSGGEKALTAIALLFAVYMVKPSPFCILDEVDAPLDDVNIGKFTRVIKQFAGDTQFIIVTHNKLTMQSADYLYGVTMAEEGLSNLVSVNLGEYAR
ncbi:MAG: chromosome segregation protein SMC [Calditrichaeota bacterium]|nr:chromosome segregation protein SMC [Calditrichota bacterium]